MTIWRNNKFPMFGTNYGNFSVCILILNFAIINFTAKLICCLFDKITSRKRFAYTLFIISQCEINTDRANKVAEDGENGALIKYELSRPNLSIKI